MSLDSPAAVKAALLALLAPAGVPAVAGVDIVYDHEPDRGQGAKAVMMTMFTAGFTPTEYLIAVRIYVTTDADARTAQATMDALMQTADRVIGSTGRFGPSNWQHDHVPEMGALVATCVLQVGREDHWSSTP